MVPGPQKDYVVRDYRRDGLRLAGLRRDRTRRAHVASNNPPPIVKSANGAGSATVPAGGKPSNVSELNLAVPASPPKRRLDHVSCEPTRSTPVGSNVVKSRSRNKVRSASANRSLASQKGPRTMIVRYCARLPS